MRCRGAWGWTARRSASTSPRRSAAGIVPGGPAKSEGEWQELVREWFPELADTRLRQVTWPAIAEHHDYIAGAAEGRGADVDDPPAAAG